jgi:hypothetical protein
MKKAILAIMVLGLCFGLATSAMAATDLDTVTITVNDVDVLEVTEATAITLTATAAGSTAYTQVTKTDIDGLKYSHNSATNNKITATAAADAANDENDITLTVKIEDQSAETIVSAGSDQTGVELWSDIAAGGYTLDLDWTADGGLATTKAGTYVWTVTFTSAAVGP